MSDSYVLKNVGQGVVSFRITLPCVDTEGMPKHKKRKILRSATKDIYIPHGGAIDLVKELGLSSAVIAEIPELITIQKSPNLRMLSELISVAATVDKQVEAKAREELKATAAAEKAEFEAQQQAQQDDLNLEAKKQADKPTKATARADKKKAKGKK